MDATADRTIPSRQASNAFWSNSHLTHRVEAPDSVPATTQPPSVGISTLDKVRSVFWQAYRHLFPPHAVAAQTSNGSIVISWSVADDPHAPHPYAAPVMLRFERALVDTMWKTEATGRLQVAQQHEPTLREGLRGYDPFVRFPNARVVNIG